MSEPSSSLPAPELEPGDFYLEDGLMVFTRAYLLKRGTCCKSGCRHCPWEYRRRSVERGVDADASDASDA